MNRSIRPLLSLIALALVSFSASAYEYSSAEKKTQIAQGNAEMQAWDNDGRLAAGDSRTAELRGIQAQIEERTQRLEVAAVMLRVAEQQTSDKTQVANMRQDYAARVETYERWRESMERRRQALLGTANPQGVLAGSR